MLSAPLHSTAALGAVLDAAAALRLAHVGMHGCGLGPESIRQVVRFLASHERLTSLFICDGQALLGGDDAAAEALGNALACARGLSKLRLSQVNLFEPPLDVGLRVLGSLVGHPSLTSLNVERNAVPASGGETRGEGGGGAAASAAAVGDALAALLACPAGRLTELRCAFCDLGDAGLRRLFAALATAPPSCRLATLDCHGNHLSADGAAEGCAATRVAKWPQSMQVLDAQPWCVVLPDVARAEATLAARGAQQSV